MLFFLRDARCLVVADSRRHSRCSYGRCDFRFASRWLFSHIVTIDEVCYEFLKFRIQLRHRGWANEVGQFARFTTQAMASIFLEAFTILWVMAQEMAQRPARIIVATQMIDGTQLKCRSRNLSGTSQYFVVDPLLCLRGQDRLAIVGFKLRSDAIRSSLQLTTDLCQP